MKLLFHATSSFCVIRIRFSASAPRQTKRRLSRIYRIHALPTVLFLLKVRASYGA